MPLLEIKYTKLEPIEIDEKNIIKTIEENHSIKFIYSGNYGNENNLIIVTNDNTIFVKGLNTNGQLGLGDSIKRINFESFKFHENIKLFEFPEFYSLILTENNEVYFAGVFFYLFNKNKITKFTKVDIKLKENIKFIKCFIDSIYLITKNNLIYALGYNDDKSLGLDEKEYFEFTEINKFIIDDNNNFITNLEIKEIKNYLYKLHYFTIILDCNGDIFRCGGCKNNMITYFTKLNLPFKIKIVTGYHEIQYIYFLNEFNEIYKITIENFLNLNVNIDNFIKINIPNSLNIKNINLSRSTLFIFDYNNNINYIYKENEVKKLNFKINSKYCSILRFQYIFLTDYKVNSTVHLTYSNLDYLLNNNFNINNIFNLLNKKYINNQIELINLIKNLNLNKTFFDISFKNKEYNYEMTCIIIVKLILLQLISKYKIDNTIILQNKNFINDTNKLYIKIIINLINYLINTFINKIQANKNVYNITDIINFIKNVNNTYNLNNFLTNLNVNQELIIYLNNLIINEISLNKLYLKLKNTEIKTLLQNTLHINLSDKDLIIDNKYLILDQLGVGGFSIVFKAFDFENCKFVALKILQNNYSFNILLQEVDLISKLKPHENIIQYLNVGKINLNNKEFPYLITELCDYSLKEKLNNSNFKLTDKLKLFEQTCIGVNYLHSNQIIHRDLKLDNILIITNIVNDIYKETIKIVDFGTAKENLNNTRTKTINIGTELYMAPEMRYLDKEGFDKIKKEEQISIIDKPLDIYSLGCILYVLITKYSLEFNNMYYFYEMLKDEKSEKKLHYYLCTNLSKILKNDKDLLNKDNLEELIEILQRLIISMVQKNPFKRPPLNIVIEIVNMIYNNLDYNNVFKLTNEQSDALLSLHDFQQKLLSKKDKLLIEMEQQLKEKEKVIEEMKRQLKLKDEEIKRLQSALLEKEK